MFEKMKAFYNRNRLGIATAEGIALGIIMTVLVRYTMNQIDMLDPAKTFYKVVFNDTITGTGIEAIVTGTQLAVLEAAKKAVEEAAVVVGA